MIEVPPTSSTSLSCLSRNPVCLMSSFLSSHKRIPTIFGQSLAWYIRSFTKLFFGIHLATEYFAQIKLTSGYSMLPTLNVADDWVYVSCFYRRGRGVRIGDVVTFRHPMFPGTGACKRVLGLPGDFVLRDSPGGERGMMVQVSSTWVVRMGG